MLHIQPIAASLTTISGCCMTPCRGKPSWVDSGDAEPVMDTLQALQLELADILIAHHHFDHIGGVAALCAIPARGLRTA